MNQLVNHARRQLAYIRAMRERFVTPDKWTSVQRERMTREATHHPDRRRVDHGGAWLAAQWAVADARRSTIPDRALRLDQDLRHRGVDIERLQAERQDAFLEGREQAEREQRNEVRRDRASDPVATSVPAAAGLAVSAALYDHAANWETTHDVDAMLEDLEQPGMDTDAVATDMDTDTNAGLSDDLEGDMPLEEAVEPEMEQAELPADLFPYSIEQQLAHVDAYGTQMIADQDAGTEFTVHSSPVVGAESGMDI